MSRGCSLCECDICPKQTSLLRFAAQIRTQGIFSRDRDPSRVDQKALELSRSFLSGSVHNPITCSDPVPGVGGRKTVPRSRLDGLEAVMPQTLRSRPTKQTAKRKTASGALFDPAVFLATVAVGRDISTHSKKDVIFAQGDDADAVFYIKKGHVKVAIIASRRSLAPATAARSLSSTGSGCSIWLPWSRT